jgi:hypothetical protein
MSVTESGHTERVGSADEPRSVFWERGLVWVEGERKGHTGGHRG